MTPPMRYVSPDEDSARWLDFPFREGDIVISTRSKSGTTWVQMICALLVFGTPDLPAPLARLSPWLDWLVEPQEEVFARLAAQTHRRFIKTHTPLDGIVLDPRATYLVVARHPLDLAVSLYHQGDNIDRDRVRELTGQAAPTTPPAPRPSLHDWLVSWIDRDVSPRDAMDSLPGVLWHLSDAWARRQQPHIELVHYDDLQDDLKGEMRRLATVLGLHPSERVWPSLVQAAGFDSMRGSASTIVPDPSGILKDARTFFRRGSSGAGAEVLDRAELDRYRQRAAQLAPRDLLTWLHRGRG